MTEPSPSVSKDKKRNRVQLSCTACRARKLKCCRTYPCTNCKRRGDADSCIFVGRGPRGRTAQDRANPSHLQDRLQHLENLVMSLSQRSGSGLDGMPAENTSKPEIFLPENSAGSDGYELLEPPGSNNLAGVQPVDPSGKLVVKDAGTRYIDGAHWRAILEEINEMKEYLHQNDDILDEGPGDEDLFAASSPALLVGISRPARMDELLADIPPRPVTDRLVSRFLNTSEPPLIVLHMPTFQKEYDQFWLNPENISLPWLSLLYSVMALAVSIYNRSEDPLPSILESPTAVMDIYRKRSAQCLAQSNYTSPGKYKVEALFLHAMSEFYASQDTQVGVSFILAITARLAMQMGYHRDASHYPNISAFEGEMRRRQWVTLCQLDTLISFQVGLPKTIQSWHYDTGLPHNLLDQDFDPSSEHLPPSRPDTEPTPSSYARNKYRLMSVFARISDLSYSHSKVPYEEILEIDRHLEEAHSLLPPIFRIRSMDQSITDSVELIMKRYSLESLYQKARCVLHRRYLAEARSNLRYAYSQWVCISAAKEILRHQVDIYNESQPGGRLYRDTLYLNSIQNTDYLLAAMIICLELSYGHSEGQRVGAGNEISVVLNGRDELLATLETSHRILESRRRSADSQKAYAGLTVMLQWLKGDRKDVWQFGQSEDQFGGMWSVGEPVDPALLNLGLVFP